MHDARFANSEFLINLIPETRVSVKNQRVIHGREEKVETVAAQQLTSGEKARGFVLHARNFLHHVHLGPFSAGQAKQRVELHREKRVDLLARFTIHN